MIDPPLIPGKQTDTHKQNTAPYRLKEAFHSEKKPKTSVCIPHLQEKPARCLSFIALFIGQLLGKYSRK